MRAVMIHVSIGIRTFLELGIRVAAGFFRCRKDPIGDISSLSCGKHYRVQELQFAYDRFAGLALAVAVIVIDDAKLATFR
jgi:hypothetical protein